MGLKVETGVRPLRTPDVEAPAPQTQAPIDGVDARRPWRPPDPTPRDAQRIPTIGRPRRVKPLDLSPVSIPFEDWPDPASLTMDWEALPERYRAGDDPDEMLVLYRGTTAGQTEHGMWSEAFRLFGFDAIEKGQALAHAPTWELAGQIDRFTSSSELSPFLPAAWDRDRSEGWATKNRELYEIHVPARRVIVDGDNTGNLQEAMILGAVFPQEIVSGPDGAPAYPDAWRELSDAWRVRAHLDANRAQRIAVDVTTYGKERGFRLRASERFVDADTLAEWQARLDGVGVDALVEASRAQKQSKRQLIALGEGDDAVTLLFQGARRGFLAKTDADAHFIFSIVPPGAFD